MSDGWKKKQWRESLQLCDVSRAPRVYVPRPILPKRDPHTVILYTGGWEEEVSDGDTTREGRVDGDEGKTHTYTHTSFAHITYNIYYYKSLLISRSLEEINFCYARMHRASVGGGGRATIGLKGWLTDAVFRRANCIIIIIIAYWHCTA